MPRYASPEYPFRSRFLMRFPAFEAIHVPYASAEGKMRGRRGVAESGAVPAGGRDMNSESFIRPLPSQCSAAPHAGMRLARSGTRKSSSGSPRWLMKACLRAGMKVSGPPQKRMPGFSSQPWERVVTVCTATAWKMDAAMSVFGTFLLIRFCTSVLEKTPHREAMGCIWVACPASVSTRLSPCRAAGPSGR